MSRRGIGLCFVLVCACAAAQDMDHLQIHGFATQGFLYSSNNNYLTMKSGEGSLQWTEGAVSISDAVTDKLRIGMQLHMSQIGDFGGPKLVVDWASGDYTLIVLFFQAEDGIRDYRVTGVQTCALPISVVAVS